MAWLHLGGKRIIFMEALPFLHGRRDLLITSKKIIEFTIWILLRDMHLPSTKDLRAFELAAKLGSIKAAADQLHLTPSALSRRIQSLEEELGNALFIRDARGVTLTEAGRQYAQRLADIFQALEQATSSVRVSQGLRLNVIAPSTIIEVILHSLPSFEKRLPEIELELHACVGSRPTNLELRDSEIFFSWGEGELEGWESWNITPRAHIVPLCTPHFLKNGRPFSTDELTKQTWIVVASYEEGWQRWFDALGEPMPKAARTIRVSSGKLAATATLQGQGIMISNGFGGHSPFYVEMGHLVPAHALHALTPGFGYHLHVRPHPKNPAVDSFQSWFFSEVWCEAGWRKLVAASRQLGLSEQ